MTLLGFKPSNVSCTQMDLPDFHEAAKNENMTVDEMRMKMKKEGKLPPRTYRGRPLNLASTGQTPLFSFICHSFILPFFFLYL